MKKNKFLCLIFLFCLIMQMSVPVSAVMQGYHAGPKTYELTAEECVEVSGAVAEGSGVTLQSGGKARYEFYLPFDAESITVEFSGNAAPITVEDGIASYVIKPEEKASSATHTLETVIRMGEQNVTFTADGYASVSKIIFNKKTVTVSDAFSVYNLPSLSDEENKVQGAVLIHTKASAIMANGSTRYINVDDPKETPKNINGSVYLPAHTLARAFGAYYEELPENSYVLLRDSLSGAELMFTADWAYLEKNGQTAQIENAVVFENGKAYLPVRLVAEAFDKRIDFYNNLIAIDDNKQYVHDELYDSVLRAYIESVLKPFIPDSKTGRTYHVAQTAQASDENTGTQDAPFKTISRAGAVAVAGDTVIVHGGTYRETVTVKNNGEPAKPIVFKAAEGEDVVISALEPIKGFAEYENGIYVASFPWDLGAGRNQVFYNGTSVPEARYPNGPGIDIGEGVEPLSDNWAVVGDLVTDPNNNLRVTSETLLNQDEDDYWKGAYFVTERGYCYTLNTAVVESSTKGELKLDGTSTSVYYWDTEQANQWNWGYLVGHRHAIDQAGEWVVENNTLFMMPPEGSDPETLVVEAKRRQLIADLADNQYVQLKGFTTIGGSMRLNNSEMCVIDDCTIRYNNHFILSKDQHSGFIDDANVKDPNGAPARGEVGLYVGGRNNVLTNNVFEEAAGAAVYGVGLYTYIENNYIDSCGYAGSYVAGLNFNGEGWKDKLTPRGGHLIVQNTVFNCGRSPLQITRPAAMDVWPMVPYEVAYNEFYNGMLASLDTGIVYTYFVDHGNSRIKAKFHNNYVYNTQEETNPYSFGIYWDGGTQNIDTYENLIFTTHEGVQFMHGAVYTQLSPAALASCNVWNNNYVTGITGGRDGLQPEHYPENVKPYDAGSTYGRDAYTVNYDSRSLETTIAESRALRPDGASEGVIQNADGSYEITGDGQWVKFSNVDCQNMGKVEVYFKGDKYKTDSQSGSVKLVYDSPDSNNTVTLGQPKLLSTYLDHSENSLSRTIPIMTGTHDVYLVFNGLTDFDAIGLKFGLVERLNGSHTNVIYGGNFNGYVQTGSTDFAPTVKYHAGDSKNPFVNNTWRGTTFTYANVTVEYDTDTLLVNYNTSPENCGQTVSIRLDSIGAEPIAQFVTEATGWGVWDIEHEVKLNQPLEKGTHDVYVSFDDEDGSGSCNLYYIRFVNPNEATAETSAAADSQNN